MPVRAWSAAALVVLAPAAGAASPADGLVGPDLATLVGRLHPVLVHFPIALLLTAALLELWRRIARRDEPSQSALVCLALGTLGAAFAALSGWELAALEHAGREDGTLFGHRWAGVGAGGLAALALVLGLARRAARWRWLRACHHAALLACAGTVVVGGHLGGTLVYGEGYLVDALASVPPLARVLPAADTRDVAPATAWPAPRVELPARAWPRDAAAARRASATASRTGAPGGAGPGAASAGPVDGPDAVLGVAAAGAALAAGAAPAAVAPSFLDDVWPILDARCVRCHGPRKQKGRLRLDTEAGVARVTAPGARDPGARDASELFVRVTLPAHHIDAMPPEGGPLGADEIETLGRWIDAGARWESPAVAATPPALADPDATASAAPSGPVAAASATPASLAGAIAPAPRPAVPVLTEPAPEVRARLDAALDALRAHGARAGRLAADGPALEVVLTPDVGDVDAALLAEVAALGPYLVRLDLGGRALADDDLRALAALTSLRELGAARTPLGDDALAHLVPFERLEVLNLHATRVTDAGLLRLPALPSLRRVYLWRSGVTPDGAAALRAARPGLLVDLGEGGAAALELAGARARTAADGDGMPTTGADSADDDGGEEPTSGGAGPATPPASDTDG